MTGTRSSSWAERTIFPLFSRLTAALKAPKTVFFNSAERPDLPEDHVGPGYT